MNERREGDEQQGTVNENDDFEIDIDSLLATVDELPTDVVLEQLDFGSIREYAYDDEEDDNESLPKQLRCVAHTLNLIGTDFDKHLKENERNCSDFLEKAHSKLKKFWNLSHRSCPTREIVENVCGRVFPVPSLTRWNSKFDCIQLAEKFKQQINKSIEQINAVKFKNAHRLEKFTAIEWKILKDYCSCMQLIAAGLDILQGEKRACCGYILPVLYEIREGLTDLVRNGFASDYGNNIQETLEHCFENRFKNMMRIGDENKDIILAAAVHPNFKLSWIQEESDREYVQNMLINACVEYSNVNVISPAVEATQADKDSNSSTENGFFKHLRGKEQQRRSSGDDSITLDIYKYILQPLAEPSLSEFRISTVLEEMFRLSNTTLCSSAPVERLFSKALIVFTPRRNRISDDHFEKALFVQHNYNL